MFYAYILRSERDPKVVYHGFTRDLKKRLEVHNCGGNRSTSAMKP
jgi:predicted GIY-YIG superfamily endonuclease